MRYTNTRAYHSKGRVGGSIFSKIFSMVKKVIPKVSNVIKRVAPQAKKAVRFARKTGDYYVKNKDQIDNIAKVVTDNVVPERYRGRIKNVYTGVTNTIPKVNQVIDAIDPPKEGGFVINEKGTAGRLFLSPGGSYDKGGRLFLSPGGSYDTDIGYLPIEKKKKKYKVSASERLRAIIGKK